MGIGLEVYDASGRLRLGTGDYLVRMLGTIDIGVTAGSYVDGNLSAGGTPFVIVYPSAGSGAKPNGNSTPYVTVSGNTISWNWADSGNTSARLSATVFYGLR